MGCVRDGVMDRAVPKGIGGPAATVDSARQGGLSDAEALRSVAATHRQRLAVPPVGRRPPALCSSRLDPPYKTSMVIQPGHAIARPATRHRCMCRR